MRCDLELNTDFSDMMRLSRNERSFVFLLVAAIVPCATCVQTELEIGGQLQS